MTNFRYANLLSKLSGTRVIMDRNARSEYALAYDNSPDFSKREHINPDGQEAIYAIQHLEAIIYHQKKDLEDLYHEVEWYRNNRGLGVL